MGFEIDWLSLLIGFALAAVIFNLNQIVGAYMRKKKAQEELKKVELDLNRIKSEIEESSRILKERLTADMEKEKK